LFKFSGAKIQKNLIATKKYLNFALHYDYADEEIYA